MQYGNYRTDFHHQTNFRVLLGTGGLCTMLFFMWPNDSRKQLDEKRDITYGFLYVGPNPDGESIRVEGYAKGNGKICKIERYDFQLDKEKSGIFASTEIPRRESIATDLEVRKYLIDRDIDRNGVPAPLQMRFICGNRITSINPQSYRSPLPCGQSRQGLSVRIAKIERDVIFGHNQYIRQNPNTIEELRRDMTR
jgi:hypothetical protein